MFKRVLGAIVALVIGAVILVVTPAPAQADPAGCTTAWSSWREAGSPVWGRWRYCTAQDGSWTWYKLQVDDQLSDGYAVHLEVEFTPNTWSHLAGSDPSEGNWLQSTGDGETSLWPAWTAIGEPTRVRLIKGAIWPSHQFIVNGGTWVVSA